MGVRDVFDKTASKASEEDFIKQISGIDWNTPDVASKVAQIVGQNPRGYTKNTASLLDMFHDLGAKKAPDFSSIASHGSAALAKAQEVFQKTGSMDAAHAAAADLIAGNKEDAKRGRSLTAKQQDELKEAEDAVMSAVNPEIPDADSNKSDFDAYVKEKVEAFKKVHGRAPDGNSASDWSEAHQLWSKSKSDKALDDLKKSVNRYRQFGYEVPEHLLELVGEKPASSAVPAAVPVTSPSASSLGEGAGAIAKSPIIPNGSADSFSAYEDTMKARAPQMLEGDPMNIFQKAGTKDLLDYYMVSTPDDKDSSTDLKAAKEERSNSARELFKKIGIDLDGMSYREQVKAFDALDQAAKFVAAQMGPHAYKGKVGFAAPTGAKISPIKSIKLKS